MTENFLNFCFSTPIFFKKIEKNDWTAVWNSTGFKGFYYFSVIFPDQMMFLSIKSAKISRFLWSLIWVYHAEIMCSDLHFRNYVRALEHEKWGAPEPFWSLAGGHRTETSLTHPPALWLGSVTTQLTWPPALSRRFLKIWSEKCTAVPKISKLLITSKSRALIADM